MLRLGTPCNSMCQEKATESLLLWRKSGRVFDNIEIMLDLIDLVFRGHWEFASESVCC
jgi:hypothetical protein